jgi:hypothetical protein
MQNAYLDLIRDTLSLLREEKKNYLLIDPALLHFFPLQAKRQAAPAAPALPIEERKPLAPEVVPVKTEEKKESPPPILKTPEPPPEKIETHFLPQEPPSPKFDNFTDLKQLFQKIAPDFHLPTPISTKIKPRTFPS